MSHAEKPVDKPNQKPEDVSLEEVKTSAGAEPQDAAGSSEEGAAEAAVTVDPHAEQVEEQSPELEAALAEVAQLKDAYMRAMAEQENVRRRSEKEVANSRKFAVEGFAKEMLNVYDSLKLACDIDIGEDAAEVVKNVHEGVQITLKQLQAAMAKFAVVEVAPQVGDKLDPNVHQAMSILESEEVESGHIINVIQPGFTLHERLLRPAMVVVAK
ncbi:MAG: nucleotide exchange factor GrpE [Gammaproteobacteria bacterium]|nr:nucleotide exchange factor GrpE [Gammaproteobacteria bacterium]